MLGLMALGGTVTRADLHAIVARFG